MTSIELSPFHRRDLTLAGFLLHNRWPADLREWTQVLALAVRVAAVPGLVRCSELFATDDEAVEVPKPDVVAVVSDAGPAVGEDSPEPGSLSAPHAVMVLHPPGQGPPAEEEMAAGCLFLPGLPDLGMGHQACWIKADSQGNLGQLLVAQDVDPVSDPDVAVLATLVAA